MRRAYKTLTVILLMFTIAAGIIPAALWTARADTFRPFDTTNVMDDLRSTDIFDVENLPLIAATSEPRIVHVAEFGYSYNSKTQSNYGLYLYIYNPQRLAFEGNSAQNKVQLAVSYGGNGEPDDYDKFNIYYCGKSNESPYKDMFYKFRVIDKAGNDGKTIAQRVNRDERRYDISGIEILTEGAAIAEEYPKKKEKKWGTYKFTGYGAGLGEDVAAESTLKCEVTELETIGLEVKNTFFRSGIYAKNLHHQLDSVYFSVPNIFLEKYGRLQKIKAEWYEYKTKEIVVTSNSSFYNKAINYVGSAINNFTGGIGYGLAYEYRQIPVGGGVTSLANWTWNCGNYVISPACDTLYYLFKTDDIKKYNPSKVVGGVTSNELYEHIRNYDKTYKNGALEIKDDIISADLFLDTVDEGRTRGANLNREFDADIDILEMLSYSAGNPGFIDLTRDFGFWNVLINNLPDLNDTHENIEPILPIKDEYTKGSVAEISKKLLIREEDVEDFRNYANNAKKNNETVFLFRFAVTDYFSGALSIFEPNGGVLGLTHKTTEGQAYMAQETVFLNFDIIQLTFNREGDYKTIAAVSSPIDIINGITPPAVFGNNVKSWPWWVWLLIIVGAIILVFTVLFIVIPNVAYKIIKLICKAIWTVIKFIFKALWWLICQPFKLIKKAINARKERAV